MRKLFGNTGIFHNYRGLDCKMFKKIFAIFTLVCLSSQLAAQALTLNCESQMPGVYTGLGPAYVSFRTTIDIAKGQATLGPFVGRYSDEVLDKTPYLRSEHQLDVLKLSSQSLVAMSPEEDEKLLIIVDRQTSAVTFMLLEDSNHISATSDCSQGF